jgi:uncharacterized protein (TIGR02145 family)
MNCSMPGSTVNFTEFNPCHTAVTGDYWYLTDTRESNNNQTYKVKKLADGHVWMVQDLKFGDKCNKETFRGSNGSDQTGNVTTLTDKTYYGDCTNVKASFTPTNRGYLYDWAAAINKSGAYHGASSKVGCSGTGSSANACQGICPNGWHLPSADANGEFQTLSKADGFCASASTCWLDGSFFEGVAAGLLDHDGSWYGTASMWLHNSTDISGSRIIETSFSNASLNACSGCASERTQGAQVRCVMNY